MNITVRGEQVPAIGLGTWQLSGETCVRSVEQALNLGYRHLDTAQDYRNEAEVGKGLRKARVERAEVFLVTKVHPSNFAYEKTVRSTHESLKRLGTGYVDLLLMHWPNPDVPLEETLGAMRALQEEGSVRHLGVSNFSPLLVEEAARHAEIFCNEIEYHPYLAQKGLLAQSREMGYLLTAYSPLAKGRVLRDPTLRELAETYGKTPAQVTLRWLVQQGVAAIPKSANDERRRANLEIFDFALSNEDMSVISGLARELRLDPVSVYARG